MTDQPTIYDLAGGDAPFRELVERFYARVEGDVLLRPIYPADLEPGKEGLFLFIAQYFGGPPRYNQQRGHPRLRIRHAPFVIGQAQRDAWVAHMLAAIDEVGFAEPVRAALREYFERAATFLINHQAHSGIELRG